MALFGQGLIEAFTEDPTVRLIAIAWVLDFLLGVFAAVKTKTFRLSYIADTFRNDVIGKILPYYTLWAALHVTGIDWSVGGFDVIEETAGAIVVAALVGSVLSSLRDLGLTGVKDASDAIAGPDPSTPAPPVSPST